MSNDAFREILFIALRDAKTEKDGQALLTRAKLAAGTGTIPELVYDIILKTCGKTATSELTDQERFFLRGLLTAVLRGEDVAKALRIDPPPKVGHRKRSELPEAIWKGANPSEGWFSQEDHAGSEGKITGRYSDPAAEAAAAEAYRAVRYD